MIVCRLDELEERTAKGLYFNKIDGIFAVKQDGQVYVYKNQCPHLGIPLEMMPDKFLDLDKRYIQCSTHGALFKIENGFCVAGPCAGASLIQHPFEIIDGVIHVQD